MCWNTFIYMKQVKQSHLKSSIKHTITNFNDNFNPKLLSLFWWPLALLVCCMPLYMWSRIHYRGYLTDLNYLVLTYNMIQSSRILRDISSFQMGFFFPSRVDLLAYDAPCGFLQIIAHRICSGCFQLPNSTVSTGQCRQNGKSDTNIIDKWFDIVLIWTTMNINTVNM